MGWQGTPDRRTLSQYSVNRNKDLEDNEEEVLLIGLRRLQLLLQLLDVLLRRLLGAAAASGAAPLLGTI
jgi:hypothetical protein